MIKEIPDSIELAQALRRADVTFAPTSITFEKRTGSAKVRVNGAFTAGALRAIAADLDKLAAAVEVVTR